METHPDMLLHNASGLPALGWGNLHVMGATSEDTSQWYEKGLLAPGVDYDAPHPYLRGNCDPMDGDGNIALPAGPGLGYDIVWDHIDANRVPA